MADPVEIERRGDVAIIALRGGKANALNVRLLDALHTALGRVELDAAAVVITGEGRAFSAGLALPELVGLDRAGMTATMDVFDRAMRSVLAFPRATIAAINGHAIAGGCVLGLMCDKRVMAAGDAKIGLSEIQLGIGLPAIVVEPLRARVASASLHAIALEGRMFAADDALRFGLVDEVVDAAGLVDHAVALANTLSAAPLAYTQIKRALLATVIEDFERRRFAERERWLDTWFSDDAQSLLRAAVERLGKR